MISPSQLNAVKSLKPNQLSSYLSYSGWLAEGVVNDVVQVWHRKEKEYESFEIVLPLTIAIKDYAQRILDLVKVLAEFEQRSELEVINDLCNFFADVIKVRVIHDDVKEGSIPLNDGVLLFEKAKDLMVSAVKSTYSKRKYFGGGKLADEIVNFLDKMRLGQTEHGSYVVNLIAPIMYKEEQQEELVKTSVTRAITENLSRSLNAIDRSIEEYKSTQSMSSFDSAIESGVSANLCDALIGISGELKNRDVTVSISLSVAEKDLREIKQEHTFDSSVIPYLQIASDYYKEKYVLYDQVVSGLVIKLSHEENEEIGAIYIYASIHGDEKAVKIELPTDDYWKAHSAHKKLQLIECSGDLHVSPRSAKLLNVKNFLVHENPDMFDED
ncbi:MAG: hypothetical protein AB2724_18930 [Candidatus Thiodiazotropha sp.]